MIRCDYKYLVELVIIYLGEVPPTQPDGIHFPAPIAISSARFMARIIYSLSMEMFGATGKAYLKMKPDDASGTKACSDKISVRCR